MQTIGIRELKARLSHYLDRVQTGERLTVSDRGRPVATIEPIDGAMPRFEWARRMVAEGKASWAGGKPAGLSPGIPGRGRLTSDIISEDRR
jgi:prevent-host-death family protein